MNNYEDLIYKKISIGCCGDSSNAEATIIDNVISIKQNSNYNITNYELFLSGLIISKVEYFTNTWSNTKTYEPKFIAKEANRFVLPIDFKSKNVTKIKIYYTDGIIDPTEFTINYITSDTRSWDAKMLQEEIDMLVKNTAIGTASGTEYFRTVFFKKCSPNCAKTIVNWFLIAKRKEAGSQINNFVIKKYLLSKDIITDFREYSNSPYVAFNAGFRFSIHSGRMVYPISKSE